MRINHGLVLIVSTLSAGLLISCVKPVEEASSEQADAADLNTQPADQDTNATAQGSDGQPSATTAKRTEQAIAINPETTSRYLTHVADEVIIPAYAEVTEHSERLHALARQSCQDAPVRGTPLAELQEQWRRLAQAWARAEVVNFGPATASMSHLYINYFPDERGVVHDGVTELMSAYPRISAAQLADESAIVQGIPGLEDVLFSTAQLDAAQCAYVISASDALSTRLQDIQASWRVGSTQLLAIDSVADSDQGLNQWFNAVLAFIETMKSSAIAQPLGLTGTAKGHVPAATAKHSRAIISAKVDALTGILTDPMLIALLNSSAQNDLVNGLASELADTTALLAQMPEDITDASRADQQALLTQLTRLTRLIKRELIPTLGVRVGFNSTDGD